MTLAAFLAAWILHLMAAASPGPAILMAARTGVTQGFRTGVLLAIGIGFGAVFWAVAALFGLAVLFAAAPAFLWGFKIAGGLFLLWMAVRMWQHADDPLSLTDAGPVPQSPWKAFRTGLFTNLSNPKPAVFFGAVFIGTVPPGTSPAWLLALLLMIFANEVFCNVVVARIFSFEGPRRAYRRLKTRIDRAFGGLLAVLGAKVALT